MEGQSRFYTILYNNYINSWISIGLNALQCSCKVPGCFAEMSGHPWDDDFLARMLYHQTIMPILTKQRFRRTHARHQVVFKTAMGEMTGGSVGPFHGFCEECSIV